MSEKIALIGFVNTEEILTDTIKSQTPNVQVDGYELFPNEAFGRSVDERYPLYGVNETGEFGLHHLDRLQQIGGAAYNAVNLGPIPATLIAERILHETSIDYVGPRKNELEYELDKTLIAEIFPDATNVLPPTQILETYDRQTIATAIEKLGGDVVLKFVGEYPKYYQDSETRRVRMLSEFVNDSELQEFITNSIDASGKAIIQKKIEGQQFSYTALVDGNGGVFRLGENICYKHRYDGETGPLGDGTGSVSINNTLPGIVSEDDIAYIENSIVTPYTTYLGEKLGRYPKTFLNIDLIKADDGKVYLLEVNNREPGGHTAASLLSGLETPLAEVLQATQEGRVSELEARYRLGAAAVVSAYPENFPYPFDDENNRPQIVIPKLRIEDDVKIYTGWVDVEEDRVDSVLARAKLSPTMLFSSHAPSLDEATRRIYERMYQVVPRGFDYRKDIGQ